MKKSRKEWEEKKKRFDLKTIRAILLVFLIPCLIGMMVFQQMEIKGLKEKIPSPGLGELERLTDSVVILRFQQKIPEKEYLGLGVVVKDKENNQKYIISLYHILTKGGEITMEVIQKNLGVYLWSGEGKGRELKWRPDPKVDLVSYELPNDLYSHYPEMPIGNSDNLKSGQKVFLIGFPWADEIILREGIIGATKAPKSTLKFIQEEGSTELGENDIIFLSYISSPGDSGGPILTFDDGKLKMIGIHKGYRGLRIGEQIVPLISFGIKINPILSHTRELIKRF
jgi:S1-C subfamily serine protease